jgi:hypothetical protein
LSSNLIHDKRNLKRFFVMTAGKPNLPAPSILYSVSVCPFEDWNKAHKSTSQWRHEVHSMMFTASISEPHSEVEEKIVNCFICVCK